MNNEQLLREVIRLSLVEQSFQQPQSKMRKIKLTVPQESGLIKTIELSESYIVGVLGIPRNLLLESVYDSKLNKVILKEHLLFEGWWSEAKQLLGKGIDKIKETSNDIVDVIENFGSNAKGVVAGLWAAASDSNILGKVTGAASQLASRRATDIFEPLTKITNLLKSTEIGKKAAGVFSNIIEKIKTLLKSFTSLDGWKGMLSSAAVYLGIKFLRSKIGTTIQDIADKCKSGDWKSIANEITKGVFAKSLDAISAPETEQENEENEEDEEDEETSSEGSYIRIVINFINSKVINAIKNFIFEKIKSIAGDAIAALAGPVAWIKTAVTIFKTTDFVVETLMDIISRAKGPFNKL